MTTFSPCLLSLQFSLILCIVNVLPLCLEEWFLTWDPWTPQEGPQKDFRCSMNQQMNWLNLKNISIICILFIALFFNKGSTTVLKLERGSTAHKSLRTTGLHYTLHLSKRHVFYCLTILFHISALQYCIQTAILDTIYITNIKLVYSNRAVYSCTFPRIYITGGKIYYLCCAWDNGPTLLGCFPILIFSAVRQQSQKTCGGLFRYTSLRMGNSVLCCLHTLKKKSFTKFGRSDPRHTE